MPLHDENSGLQMARIQAETCNIWASRWNQADVIRSMVIASGQSAAFAALVALLAGCSTSEPSVERSDKSVKVAVAEVSDIPISGSLSGVVAAQKQQSLAFRVGGQIAHFAAEVGDHVSKGQLLAQIDPRDLSSDYDLAKAAVSAANASLTQVQATFDRQDALFAKGNTTRASFDAARAALDSAKADLAGAEADASSAKEALDYANLIALEDGIVLTRTAQTGQVVQSGEPVFVIAVDGPRDAIFQANDRIVDGLPVDTRVAVTLLSNPDVQATGHAREYSPALDEETSTVRIKVGLDRETPDMPLGASVTGEIALAPLHGFALPWSALTSDEKGPAVWVIQPDTGEAALASVVVGRYLEDVVVVESGLEDGNTVITSGVDMLFPGEKVTPRQEVSQ